jgi:hypothetical protein
MLTRFELSQRQSRCSLSSLPPRCRSCRYTTSPAATTPSLRRAATYRLTKAFGTSAPSWLART